VPTLILSNRFPLHMGLLAALSAGCISLTGLLVVDAVWVQWWAESGWISVFNAHSALLVPILVAWALSPVLLIVVAGIFWRNRRQKIYPQKALAVWIALLALSSSALLVNPAQYVAFTVLLLGPGKNASRLQERAAGFDSVFLLDALLLRGAQLQKNLLLIAAEEDSPDVVARLIALGKPVNEQFPPVNVTPLHHAVDARRYENAKLLIAAGARPDVSDSLGRTPLGIASRMKDDKMLRILEQAPKGG
jgi:hypothetical protein